MSNSTDKPSPYYTTEGIKRFRKGHPVEQQQDRLATEEPLAILLRQPSQTDFPLVVTMRTPGDDRELAAGFLLTEGLIKQASDIASMDYDLESTHEENTLVVTLAKHCKINPEQLERYFITHSSCGVCGKTSIQAIEMKHTPELDNENPSVSTELLYQLPEKQKSNQQQFSSTGGTHSSALFTAEGEMLCLKEDVGRHNAMDKLIGDMLIKDKLALAAQSIVLVSGRTSFELIQKALMANIPFMASIGAPSSLAVQLAQRHQMTLVGFLKDGSFNTYSGHHRIRH